MLSRTQVNLGSRLIRWLSSDFNENEEESLILIKTIEKSLAALDGQPCDFREGVEKDALRFLLFPLAYWKLVGKTSELSIRVFLRGVKFLFIRLRGGRRNINPIETIAALEPLLSQVPKSLVGEAISFGQAVDDPATSRLERVRENALAGETSTLSQEAIARLERLF